MVHRPSARIPKLPERHPALGIKIFWCAPEVGYYVKRYWAVNESVDKYCWQMVRDYELVS
jgi:hypothetical protein